MELYLAVSDLLSRFDIELFETSRRDVSMEHDFLAPFGPSDNRNVQLIVV